MRKSRMPLLAIVFLVGYIACKPKSIQPPDAQLLSSFLRSYTKGVISSASLLKYVFVEDMVEEEAIGKSLDQNIFKLKPAVDGNAYWEAKNVLVFKPGANLQPGTTYQVSLDLTKLKPGWQEKLKTIDYSFQTREMSFVVSKPKLGLNASNQYDLIGEVQVSDEMESSKIEQLLQADQDHTALQISWQHRGNNMSTYTIHNAIPKKSSQVNLNWSGQSIGLQESGFHQVLLPDPDKFTILDISHEPAPQSRIITAFSDNLKTTQTLDGLISVKGVTGALRHVIDGNKIYTYLPGDQSGDVTVVFSPGVVSIHNIKLSEGVEWELSVSGTKPQVRFSGKGNILPQSNETLLPFEAIGLQAVDVEIFKIFDNNILQFLQSNQLDENNEIYRVGRLVSQTKVELKSLQSNADITKWGHYALDLGPLITVSPNAIYQVRIGFKPGYTLLTCTSDWVQNIPDAEDSELISFYDDNYYGPLGYYPNYWSDREDPCKAAYYNTDHFISKNVLISNLGIIGKISDHQLFAAVTDLRTTDPIVGAMVDVYDFQLQKIASLTTDGEGIAQQLMTDKPYAIVVSNQGDKGYLRMAEGLNLSMSAFDTEGQQVDHGINGYLFAERGVWRPGDSIFLSFILNDRELNLPSGHPITLKVYDARNKLVLQKISTQPVGAIYSFPFKTMPDAITGNWRAVVKAGGAEFTKILKVEAIKPNRLKILWDAAAEILPSQTNIGLSAQWLTGIQANNLTAKVKAKWSASKASWPAFKNFEFHDPARAQIDASEIALFDGKLDAQGQALVPLKISKDFKPSGKMNLLFNLEVAEPGGDFSTMSQGSIYHPYKQYSGVNLPSDPWGYRSLQINKPSTIQVVSIDPQGKAQSKRKLTIGLYQMDWRWWWEQRDNAYADFNSSTHNKAIQKTTVTTNANGLASWDVTITQWGRYMVRVCDVESGHCSGDFAYAGWPDEGEGGNRFDMATLVRLQTSKEKYSANETVQLNIPAPALSKMLITLENGSKVLESHWVTATGSSVDKPFVFSFQASPQMAPAVYAHVEMIQPHGMRANDLPMRMYGLLPITIEDGTARIEPKINAPASFKPDRVETVEVSESQGRAMTYILDIVDEGLLDLTNFKTPDPYNHFYSRPALGVRTWDVYDYVMGAYGGKLESVLSIGGDAGPINNNTNATSRFKSPVMHLGPFQLKKGEKKKHAVTIANYTGSVRLMVIAADDHAYGNAEKAVAVKSPLMVLPTLPRILSTDEKLTLPVNLFVTEPSIRQVAISVKDQNNQVTFIDKTKNVEVTGVGESMAYFDFTTGSVTGPSKIIIEAKANGETARQEIDIETRNPNPPFTEVNTQVIEPGQTKTVNLSNPNTANVIKRMIEVSTLQPIGLTKYLDQLVRYPYGCAEQTISAIFPQLYLDQFVTMDADQKKSVHTNIEEGIAKLSKFNLSDGSFSLWPGSGQYVDSWVTSYIGHFLIEAQSKGYLVPDHILQNWKAYQKRTANLYDPAQKSLYKANHGIDQAYRLYTLALAGSPDLGAMNRLKEYNELGNNARWRLAAAYAVAGQVETAKSLMTRSQEFNTDYIESGYSYGSTLRDQAMVMETYLHMGDKTKAAEYASDISKQLNGDILWNTQALAYALQVLGKFQGTASSAGANWTFKYQPQGGTKQSISAKTSSFFIQPDPAKGNSSTIAIENTSSTPIFVQSSVTAQSLVDNRGDESSNLLLSVKYTDEGHQVTDPATLKKGDQINIDITITHPGQGKPAYHNLALTHMLPSGWEIINERMQDGQVASNSLFQYQDIRDDRVLTFFDLQPGAKKIISIRARASYEGQYHLPAISCEEMYDAKVHARVKGDQVEVL